MFVIRHQVLGVLCAEGAVEAANRGPGSPRLGVPMVT